MKLRSVLTIAAIVGALFGLGLFLMPAFFLGQNGVDANAAAVFMARTAGSVLLGLAVINWMARADLKSPATMGIVYGNIFTHLLGLIGDSLAINAGVITKYPYMGVVVHILIIALFAYALMSPKKD